MHEKQKLLLKLINEDKDLGSYSLRTIAEKMGSENKPQLAKYHLQKLAEAGCGAPLKTSADEILERLSKKVKKSAA